MYFVVEKNIIEIVYKQKSKFSNENTLLSLIKSKFNTL